MGTKVLQVGKKRPMRPTVLQDSILGKIGKLGDIAAANGESAAKTPPMASMQVIKQEREVQAMSFRDGKCDHCKQDLPEGDGVFWSFYRFRFCKRCSDLLAGYVRDYSASTRGRFRTKREFLRATQWIKVS